MLLMHRVTESFMRTTILSTLGLLTISSIAQAAVTCEDLQRESDLQVLGEGDVLTKENWKTIDVVLDFSYHDCREQISQELIQVGDERLWRFRSTDDSCDGGNTYGSIYSYDLKTPIAHIYDSDIYCEKDWRDESRAINHRCDLAAEELAAKKMREFGLEFEPRHSSVKVRRPYIYSFIYVEGVVTNRDGREARINVLTDIDRCRFGSVRIEDLQL